MTGGLQSLSYIPMSAAFVGDESSHGIGTINGVSWQYNYDGTNGNWTNPGLGLVQFAYNYHSGIWLDQGTTGGLQTLSYVPLSAAFVGDGTSYDIGTIDSVDWKYQFDGTNGNWTNPGLGTSGLIQFAYNYGTGQWQDQGTTGGLQTLSYVPLSAAFVGDGTSYDIGTINGVSWQYNYDGTNGNWTNPGLGLVQFAYNYGTGQWQDQGTTGGLQTLSYVPLSAAFVGDGGSYAVHPGWGFHFDGSIGWWYASNDWRYDYSGGQWQIYEYTYLYSIWNGNFWVPIYGYAWVNSGSPGSSAAFPGG